MSSTALNAYIKSMVEERKKNRQSMIQLGLEGAKMGLKTQADQIAQERKQQDALKLQEVKQQDAMTVATMKEEGANKRAFAGIRGKQDVALINAESKGKSKSSVQRGTFNVVQALNSALTSYDNDPDSKKAGRVDFSLSTSLSNLFPNGEASEDEIKSYLKDLHSTANEKDAEYIRAKFQDRYPDIFDGREQVSPQPSASSTSTGVKPKYDPKTQKLQYNKKLNQYRVVPL